MPLLSCKLMRPQPPWVCYILKDVLGALQIDADIECDTFFPELKPEGWRMWSQSAPKRDNGMRYSFQCYVPASTSSTSNRAPELPAGLAAQHEEFQVDLSPSADSIVLWLLCLMPDSLLNVIIRQHHSRQECA